MALATPGNSAASSAALGVLSAASGRKLSKASPETPSVDNMPRSLVKLPPAAAARRSAAKATARAARALSTPAPEEASRAAASCAR
jgi:hypothetical protein